MYLKFKDKDTIYFKGYGVWDDDAKKEAFSLIHNYVKNHVRKTNVLWLSPSILDIDFSYLNEGKEEPVYILENETSYNKSFTYEGYKYRFEYACFEDGYIRIRNDHRLNTTPRD